MQCINRKKMIISFHESCFTGMSSLADRVNCIAVKEWQNKVLSHFLVSSHISQTGVNTLLIKLSNFAEDGVPV